MLADYKLRERLEPQGQDRRLPEVAAMFEAPPMAENPGTHYEFRRDTPESCRLAAVPRSVEEGRFSC